MSSSATRVGLSCFSGIAIVGQTGALSSKTVTLDVEVFLGAEKHPTLLGSLRFFNANNIRFGDFPDGMVCLIKASFAQSPTDSTIYGLSQDEYSYIGDAHSIVPLGPAPDPQHPDPIFSLMVRSNVFLSGVALDRNTDTSSFSLDVDVWISASKDSTKPSFKPTARFHCVIPDSPRYKASGKPIPYNRRFVSVSGILTDVTYYKKPAAQDLEIDRFVITVDEIVFLGQQSESSSTPAKSIPNTLDGSTPQTRRGFSFFRGSSSTVKQKVDDPRPLAPSNPSTPTPAPKHVGTGHHSTLPSTPTQPAAPKLAGNGHPSTSFSAKRASTDHASTSESGPPQKRACTGTNHSSIGPLTRSALATATSATADDSDLYG